MKDFFNYKRRLSTVVAIGNTPLGGDNPIRIQSMATVSTLDTDTAVNQAIRMIKAGAEYIRFTAQGEREAHNLQDIRLALSKQGFDTPLVADIHFNPNVADKAALFVEKVRINPGNYVESAHKHVNESEQLRERFIAFLDICRKNKTAIRIGVNHGSLSERIMSRYGDTPEGMVESCMEFLRLCREKQFERVVISIKASNTVMMVHAVRLLVRTMDEEGMHFPLHLGVTEAGDGEDGRIKSAVGIGALLVDGYGDTIRVSLSEEPEAEMPVARKLVDYIATLSNHPPIHSFASTCANDLNAQPLSIDTFTTPLHNPTYPSKRKSRPIAGIGGDNPPIVISDCPAYRSAFTESGAPPLMPDWVFITPQFISDKPICEKIILEATHWQSQPSTFPCFSASNLDEISRCNADIKFISLSINDLNDEIIQLLKTDKHTVVIANSAHIHYIGEIRAFMHRLMIAECDVPVILRREYDDTDSEAVQIKAAVDFGTLFIDGFGDGILMCHKNKTLFNAKMLDNCMFSILQATRVRISKTEYISCPGCGRTLFDLQKTIAAVKAATSHLKGLKIGIMGCIVNGPGEMADADYGYVGAGRGRINLYKGKTCVLKNIPEEAAVEKLIALITQASPFI